ncbi:NAD(P)/FAD-dependent oxidoreductase, partial [Candidatus Woesearchaeota archaeon]|nr:NAD(P)/FAD-dependent oxidoreductase [Candidatus Woesearchaeota archaeon]
DVHIFEEHKEIGKPVQCTGIISKNLKQIIPVDKFLINKVTGAVFYSKHNRFNLKTDKLQAYIVDRSKMDRWLAKEAKKAGVKIYLNRTFGSFTKTKKKLRISFENKTQKPFVCDILIGADGPISKVAKTAGLYSKRDFLVGIQAIVNGKFDPKQVQIYLGTVCPDFFAWVVPESSTRARIGLATKKGANARFKKFLAMFPDLRVQEYQGGLIPLFKEIKLKKDNIFLVGDAALQVKATTGGGVVTGLLAGEALAKSLIKNKSYSKELKKLNRELKITRMIRKSLNRFNDNKYDSLIELIDKPKIKNLLQKYGDMDFPTKFIFKILFKEPRLLRFFF